MGRNGFVYFKDKAGEWRFSLKATNGEIIATSEGYKSKPNLFKGMRAVVRNATEAAVTKAKQVKPPTEEKKPGLLKRIFR